MQSLPAEPSIPGEKRRLRKELRVLRQVLDASALARAARALHEAASAFAPLAGARSLAGYVACDGEIDVLPLLADARRKGACVLLPRHAAAGLLELVTTSVDEVLTPTGPAGIFEPSAAATDPADLATPAVLLAPAIALDRRGFRLGRGGGDYDRLLPRLRMLGWTIVGICHASQLRDELPVEAHDQAVDAILTDAGLLLPRR